MPSDPATRYAIVTMGDRPPLHPPVRLIQQWLPVTGHPNISHVGLSDLSSRVELRGHDGTIAAVDWVPRASRDAVVGGSATTALTADAADGLRRAGQSVPPDRVEATAFAVRCDFCGRFTAESGHDCPPRAARVVTAASEVVTDG